MKTALKKLPKQQRELLNELFFLKTPAIELARKQNVTESAILHRRARALTSLKKHLESSGKFNHFT